jgi:hypothetical protein
MAHEHFSAVVQGLAHAHCNSMRTRLFTFTDRNPHPLPLEEFQKRISRFTSNLRRSNSCWEHHYSALGFNPDTGRLHRHVVCLGGPYLPPAILRAHEARAGLGHVDVRAIGATAADRTRVAEYVAANGFAYAVAHAPFAPRVQPFSTSR